MNLVDLQLLIDLGLAVKIREGIHELTHAGRVLAGISPARRAESFARWWARMQAELPEEPATRFASAVCECGKSYPSPHKSNCRWRRVNR